MKTINKPKGAAAESALAVRKGKPNETDSV